MRTHEQHAIEQLIWIAHQDTPAGRIVANFLLAWWDPEGSGKWDVNELAELGAKTPEFAAHVIAALSMLSQKPTDLTAEGYGRDMRTIHALHRNAHENTKNVSSKLSS